MAAPASGARSGAELVAAAVEAMGGAAAIAALDSLEVTAACSGPNGDYRSLVVWHRDGRTIMRQSDEAGQRMMLAEGERAWELDGKGEIARSLPAEMAAMVHGHAFHPTLFELDRRFAAHRAAATGEGGCLRVEMVDSGGRPASVCLDPTTMLPARFTFEPAGPGGEIRMELRGWRKFGELLYFTEFDLRQGEEEYRWVYSTIDPDSSHRSRKEPSGAAASGAGPSGAGASDAGPSGAGASGAAWRPGERISMSLKDADLAEVLRSFARLAGFNLVLHPSVRGKVTVELQDVAWEQALEVILQTHGLGVEDDGATWRVGSR